MSAFLVLLLNLLVIHTILLFLMSIVQSNTNSLANLSWISLLLTGVEFAAQSFVLKHDCRWEHLARQVAKRRFLIIVRWVVGIYMKCTSIWPTFLTRLITLQIETFAKQLHGMVKLGESCFSLNPPERGVAVLRISQSLNHLLVKRKQKL